MERIEVEQDDLAEHVFKFPPAPHSGKVSLKVKQVSKKYDDLEVLQNVSLEVEGEKKLPL